MAVSVEARIAKLLFDRVLSLPFSPEMPVAFPGVPFQPSGVAYLVVQFAPNTNVNGFIGSQSATQYRGFLQVTVVSPKDGNGIIEPAEIAAQIADHFERGSPLSDDVVSLKIDGRPHVAAPLQDVDWVRFPVSVPYHAFA